MTYKEYEEKINGLFANPDTALAGIGPVLEELKSDLDSMEAMKVSIDEKDKKIRDLQDTNLKLYLSQGGAGEEEEEEAPAVGEAVIDELMNEIFKEEED